MEIQRYIGTELSSSKIALGRVLQTLPPRLLHDKVEDLVSWLELELRSGQQHPLVVIGAFFVYFTAISPFEKGNGRTARVVLPHRARGPRPGRRPHPRGRVRARRPRLAPARGGGRRRGR